MKKWPRKLFALALVFCLCLGYFPTSASAQGQAPNAVDSVEKKLSTIDGEATDVTLTAPQTIVYNTGTQKYGVYVEAEGLPEAEGYWVEATLGSDTTVLDTGWIWMDEEYPGIWLDLSCEAGTQTLNLNIFDSNNGGKQLYETVSFSMLFTKDLEYTVADAKAGMEPVLVSVEARNPHVICYLPEGTVSAAEALRGELVSTAGVLYGVTTENITISSNQKTADARYAGIFQGDNPYMAAIQRLQANVYLGKELTPGSYHLNIYNSKEELLYCYENIVQCSDLPVVDLNGWATSYHNNAPGATVAGVLLYLTNGDPSDFQVELWRDGKKVGTSVGWRAWTVGSNGSSTGFCYYIPVEDGLSAESNYVAKVVSSKEYVGNSSRKLYAPNNTKLVNYYSTTVDSRCFANVVAQSAGFEAGTQYKVELKKSGTLLGTQFVTPNEDGLFDIAFTDEDGEPLPLQGTGSYQLIFYQWLDSIGWNQCVNTSLYVNDVQTLSLLNTGTQAIMPVTLSNTNVGLYIDGGLNVSIQGESAVIAQFADHSKLTLKVTSLTGESAELALKSANVYSSGTNLSMVFSMPEELAQAYYDCELYYDGALVTDQERNSIFASNDLAVKDDGPSAVAAQTWVDGMTINYGVTVRNGNDEEIGLQLYTVANTSCTPDHSFTWTAGEDPVLSAEDFTGSDSMEKYSAVFLADGIPVGRLDNAYWFSQSYLDEYWDSYYGRTDEITHTVKTSASTNGSLVLYCDGVQTEDGSLPAVSEVYVHAVPAAGYELECITVKGEPIVGRAFLLTDDAEVSAVFRKQEVETFAVAVEYAAYGHVTAGGTVTTDVTEAAMGDTVTITANVNEGYTVNDLYAMQGYNLVTLTKGATPNTWTFNMPAADVTITASIRALYNASISVDNYSSYGTVTAPASAYEGVQVTVTAVPKDGSALETLTLTYYLNGEQTVDLMLSPGEEANTYVFTMPAINSVSISSSFAAPKGYTITGYKTTGGAIRSIGTEAMPGTTVTVLVEPESGYRLVDGSLKGYCTLNGNTSSVEILVSGSNYFFGMPVGDVTFSAEFELIPVSGSGDDAIATQTELYDALGSSKGAVKLTDGKTVQLIASVELKNQLGITGGDLILDLNGHNLIGLKRVTTEERGIITINEGAVFTITDTSGGKSKLGPVKDTQSACHGIWVKGGTLYVDQTLAEEPGQMTIQSAVTTEKVNSAAIKVDAGQVFFRGEGNDFTTVEGRCGGTGLWVNGGIVKVEQGIFVGGADVDADALANGSWADAVTESTLGGDAVHVTGTGVLEFTRGEAQGGANAAALHISDADKTTPCQVTVHSGTLYAAYGDGLWVEDPNAKLTVELGKFYDGAGYTVHVPEGSTLMDYLAANRLVVEIYGGEELTTDELRSACLTDAVQIEKGTVPTNGSIQEANITVDLPLTGVTAGTAEVIIPIKQVTEDVMLMAAFYDGNEKMIGVGVIACERGQNAQVLEVEYNGVPAKAHIFVMDSGESKAPLMDYITKKLVQE